MIAALRKNGHSGVDTMNLYIYNAVDRCTGRRWSSQVRARDLECLEIMLRQVYGFGFELLSAKVVATIETR